jgi:hypothetical protein
MDDKSSDITQDLVDKIYTEKIKESQSFRIIKGFSNFDLMNEDFDADKFLEVVSGKSENKDEDKKELVKKIKDEVDKKAKESYKKYKKGLDYMLDKDFEPSDPDGKESFKSIFKKSWDDFKKMGDDEKKDFLSLGFKDTLSLEADCNDKAALDAYFKGKSE